MVKSHDKREPGNDMTKRVAGCSYRATTIYHISSSPFHPYSVQFALMVIEYNGAHITHSIPTTTTYLQFCADVIRYLNHINLKTRWTRIFFVAATSPIALLILIWRHEKMLSSVLKYHTTEFHRQKKNCKAPLGVLLAH